MSDSGNYNAPARVPLKVNVFEFAQRANSQLLPLFPYMHKGAIVPCVAAFASDGSGTHIGYFVHTNTVDEVAVTHAATGPVRTGDVVVGPKTHGVGGGSTVPFFRVAVITQRQLEEGEQPEAIDFQCEACNARLYHHEFDAGVTPEHRLAGLPTIIGTCVAATAWNASEELRTCKQCGHISKPFPLPIWGWSRYVHNTNIVQKGWDLLTQTDGRSPQAGADT